MPPRTYMSEQSTLCLITQVLPPNSWITQLAKSAKHSPSNGTDEVMFRSGFSLQMWGESINCVYDSQKMDTYYA